MVNKHSHNYILFRATFKILIRINIQIYEWYELYKSFKRLPIYECGNVLGNIRILVILCRVRIFIFICNWYFCCRRLTFLLNFAIIYTNDNDTKNQSTSLLFNLAFDWGDFFSGDVCRFSFSSGSGKDYKCLQ